MGSSNSKKLRALEEDIAGLQAELRAYEEKIEAMANKISLMEGNAQLLHNAVHEYFSVVESRQDIDNLVEMVSVFGARALRGHSAVNNQKINNDKLEKLQDIIMESIAVSKNASRISLDGAS